MRSFKSIVISLPFIFAIIPFCHGASLNLEWYPNSETDLAGYNVYYGTSPGDYGNPVDVDNVTEYELTGLNAGVRYYVAITAYDTADNESEKSDEESGIATDNQTSTTTTSIVLTTTTTTPTTSTTTPPTTTIPITTTSIPGVTTIPVTTTTIQPGGNDISGSIIINNGEEVTASRTVTLNLYATVDVPQLASEGGLLAKEELGPDAIMSISNDAKQWSSFEPYKQTREWTLEPGDGLKTVYAGFRDGDGNWIAEVVHDQIILEEAQITCENPQKLQPLSVTASSTSPRYSADNLIDGNPSTIWSSVVSLFKKDEYITLDFGTTKKVSELTMHASRLFGVDLFPSNFTIQISQDNNTWLDISSMQGFVLGQSLSSGSWDINSLECRYIRIYITKSKSLFLLFKLVQIAEIEVYGCDLSGATPVLAEENLSNQQDKQQLGTTGGEAENKNTIPGTPSKPTVIFFE